MSSRKFFVLFFLCCSLPVAAAKLYLDSGWASHGSTNNKGRWLRQNIQLLEQDKTITQHWYLVYVQSDVCTQVCEKGLYTLQQVYTAFGRKQINIKPLVLSHYKFTQLENFPALEWKAKSQAITELENTLVVVNQHGLAILQYPVVDDMAHMMKTAKDIRADLRRLMSYDRGGF